MNLRAEDFKGLKQQIKITYIHERFSVASWFVCETNDHLGDFLFKTVRWVLKTSSCVLKVSDEKGKKSVLHIYKCQAWVSSNNSSIRLCTPNTSRLMRSLEHQLCDLSAQTQRPSHFALLHFHSPFAISVCGALCDCALFWSGCFLRSCLNWIPDTLPEQPEQHSQNNLTLCNVLFIGIERILF